MKLLYTSVCKTDRRIIDISKLFNIVVIIDEDFKLLANKESFLNLLLQYNTAEGVMLDIRILNMFENSNELITEICKIFKTMEFIDIERFTSNFKRVNLQTDLIVKDVQANELPIIMSEKQPIKVIKTSIKDDEKVIINTIIENPTNLSPQQLITNEKQYKIYKRLTKRMRKGIAYKYSIYNQLPHDLHKSNLTVDVESNAIIVKYVNVYGKTFEFKISPRSVREEIDRYINSDENNKFISIQKLDALLFLHHHKYINFQTIKRYLPIENSNQLSYLRQAYLESTEKR